MRRVVITGIGAVTPLGNTFPECWDSLLTGTCGTGPVQAFDASGMKWKAAGELKRFEPLDWVEPKETNRLDRFVIYAFASASMAFSDSSLQRSELEHAGVIIGSSRGGIGMLEEALSNRPTAYLMAGSTISAAASYTALRLGIKGHASGVSTACASGATAIADAVTMIRSGALDVVLAGGADAPVIPLCFEGYGRTGALSEAGISRPFDSGRDGFVLAEGGASLVLEDYVHAKNRGARVYGEVLGCGTSCDASHPTVPDRSGQALAVKRALQEAGVTSSDIAHVYAHATSTPAGDRVEAHTLREVFGSPGVRVSALKSMTGHMLGASGAFEAAVAAMTVFKKTVTPTIALKEPEDDLQHVTEPAGLPHGAVISNSFGFGGINVVLVMGNRSE